MQNKCPLVSTLVTSNRYFKDFHELPNTKQPEIIWLKQLNAKEAVELFVANSAKIFPDQIYKFIMCDPKYPIKKLVGGLNKMPYPITPEVKKQIMDRLHNFRD